MVCHCSRAGDALILRGMRFFGQHGVRAAERDLGQRFVVDLRVGTCLRAAGESDSLSDTIDYASLRRVVRSVVEEGPQRNLVEKLASDIANKVLSDYPNAVDVTVAVCKPHVAIPEIDAAGVEIYRSRDATEK